jgi:hypothetical protein
LIPAFRSSCASTGSSLAGPMYEPDRAIIEKGSVRTFPRYCLSNSKSWSSLVRSLDSFWMFIFSSFTTEDPDVEDAPVVPEMGTIELQAFRTRALREVEYRPPDYGLHRGRMSERSKKAGWHHVRYLCL